MEIKLITAKESSRFLDIMTGGVDREKISSLQERIAAAFPGPSEPLLVILGGLRYQMTKHYGGQYQARLPENPAGISSIILSYLSGQTPEGFKLKETPVAVVDFSSEPMIEAAYRMLESQGNSITRINI